MAQVDQGKDAFFEGIAFEIVFIRFFQDKRFLAPAYLDQAFLFERLQGSLRRPVGNVKQSRDFLCRRKPVSFAVKPRLDLCGEVTIDVLFQTV